MMSNTIDGLTPELMAEEARRSKKYMGEAVRNGIEAANLALGIADGATQHLIDNKEAADASAEKVFNQLLGEDEDTDTELEVLNSITSHLVDIKNSEMLKSNELIGLLEDYMKEYKSMKQRMVSGETMIKKLNKDKFDLKSELDTLKESRIKFTSVVNAMNDAVNDFGTDTPMDTAIDKAKKLLNNNKK